MRRMRKVSLLLALVALLSSMFVTPASAASPNHGPKIFQLSPKSLDNIHRRPDAFVPNETYCNDSAKQWMDLWTDANFEGRKVRWCVTDSLQDNYFKCGPGNVAKCYWNQHVSSFYFSWRQSGTSCYWRLWYENNYQGAVLNVFVYQASGDLGGWNDHVRSLETAGSGCAS